MPVVHSALRESEGQRIGYIRLSEFNAHAAEQMEQAMQGLERQRAEGYVLDLRNNPGGRLDQAIAIARMWLDEGAIVRTVDRNGRDELMVANGTSYTRPWLLFLYIKGCRNLRPE